MTEKQVHNTRRRMIAQAIGMPTHCNVRQCRRLDTCLIEEAICLIHLRERAAERFNRLIGWDPRSRIDVEED